MKIGILTDSTACLDFVDFTHDLVKVIDFTVAIDDVVYKISELDSDEFYVKQKKAKDAPKTSQGSVMEVMNKFEGMVSEGFTDVIVMTISSKLSGSLANIVMAAQEYDDKLNIHIQDTKTAAYILGDAVVESVKLIEQGLSVDEIMEAQEKMYKNDGVFFYVDTLKYLVKGGRMSSAKGFVGEMLKVKPILELDSEGAMNLLEKNRTKKKTLPMLVDLYKKNTEGRKHVVHALYTDNKEEVEEFVSQFKDDPNVVKVTLTGLTPAVSAHTGPGLIGLGYRFVEEG